MGCAASQSPVGPSQTPTAARGKRGGADAAEVTEVVPFSPPQDSFDNDTASEKNSHAYKEQMEAFYRVHSPAKVGRVDDILVKYRGRENLLYRTLKEKYGMDPSEFNDTKDGALQSPATAISKADTSSFDGDLMLEDFGNDEELKDASGFTSTEDEALRLRPPGYTDSKESR